MKVWGLRLRQHVMAALVAGEHYAQVAKDYGVPAGTVRTWWHRYRSQFAVLGSQLDMKQEMKQGVQAAGKGVGDSGECDMKQAVKQADRSVRAPVSRFETCRGLTWRDLPGKDETTMRMNFFNLKRGLYPPKVAKIPSFLEGRELLEALRQWAGMKKTRRQSKEGTSLT